MKNNTYDIPADYPERVYGGFVGMNAGIRLGAPVESGIWTAEMLEKTFGNITGYVRDYKQFAADDDANGPVFFIRALLDDAKGREPTPQDVARAWLNYTRECKGMFWWGGYGVSTEHTAYANLLHGIPAPQSGSMAQNGPMLAEQIGGQIFIDTWGLVWPCNPAKAAHWGEIAASVSHDGEGLWGARFFCAAIAEAFRCGDILEVMRRALSFIPDTSAYAQVVHAVLTFHAAHPEDFRACLRMLQREWGYDRYAGSCPIVPNAGVCALAMAYGEGQFDRTIEIATMCGWDTDCNAGNVGTVLGVMNGVCGIPERYRAPMNDTIVLSSIAGSLNTLDMPSFSYELARLGYALSNAAPPVSLPPAKDGLCFDFSLPGSTHGLRGENCRMENSGDMARTGQRSLRILFDHVSLGRHCRVYYKPFYQREDFDDERYDPAFSPQVYPGQTLRMSLYLDLQEGGDQLGLIPYVRLTTSKTVLEGGYMALEQAAWTDMAWRLPDTQGEAIDEVGFWLAGNGYYSASTGVLYLDHFHVSGPASYTIDMAKQRMNFGCVTPFVHNKGAWKLAGDYMEGLSLGISQSYTGSYDARDACIRCTIIPRHGQGHMLAVRAKGAMRAYWGGLDLEGRAAIVRQDFGETVLAEKDFDWRCDQPYVIAFAAQGSRLTLSIDGVQVLSAKDEALDSGMVGCVRRHAGRCLYGRMQISSTEQNGGNVANEN